MKTNNLKLAQYIYIMQNNHIFKYDFTKNIAQKTS